MKIGFSSCHSFNATAEFVEWTVRQLKDIPYERFEICHERVESRGGLGAVDDYVSYNVLSKLNAGKMCDPQELDRLRRIFGALKDEGKEIAFWSHELAASPRILEHYPELATPKGDLDLAHPLMTEWLEDKYRSFFSAAPEVDVIMISMTEVAWPVLHRFDSSWSPAECVGWLLSTIHKVCEEAGRTLAVRPFSAIRADYEAARQAILELPDSIEVMLKSDPFDWDPFLPINPAISTYDPKRLTVEFDLGSEYFGRGTLPVVHPDYLRERIEVARKLGVAGLTGRVDRRGISALDREGRLNVACFSALASDPTLDTETFLAEQARATYATRDGAALARQLCDAFKGVCKTLYVDGQCLWHGLFGNLDQAQRCVLFEILRPGQSLEHCADEWHVLADRTTPSVDAVRLEKDEACRMASRIYEEVSALAPEEKGLLARAKNLVIIARLYRAAVVAMQEYLLCLEKDEAETDTFRKALDALCTVADEVTDFTDESTRPLTPEPVVTFANELGEAFDAERTLMRERPGLDLADGESLVDMIAVGYPGEGHRLSKFTHGSTVVVGEDGTRRRAVKRHVEYTISTGPQGGRLLACLGGSGLLKVAQGGQTVVEHGWEDLEEARVSIDLPEGGKAATVRFERDHGTVARVGVIYSITSNATP